MQLVYQKLLDSSKSDRSDTWRVNVMKKEIPILDLINKNTYWLISKFTLIAKGARLTPEQLVKITIGDSRTSQEKDVFIEMFYNREVVLL